MIFMVSVFVVIVGFDIVLAVNATKGDTFSEIIRDFSYRLAAIPWGTGLVMGHWFWSGNRVRKRWAWPAAFASLALLEGLNVSGVGHPFVSFVVGIAAGRLAWAMQKK